MEDKKDYLDDLIAENMEDPEFAAAWRQEESRISLAAMRVQAGLTQAQVADRMKVRRERVAVIEANPLKVTLELLNKYMAAVGGSVKLVPPKEPPLTVRERRVGRPVSSKRSRSE